MLSPLQRFCGVSLCREVGLRAPTATRRPESSMPHRARFGRRSWSLHRGRTTQRSGTRPQTATADRMARSSIARAALCVRS